MPDHSEYETGNDADRGGIPRWAKLSLIIGAIVILIALVMMFVGGGTHGGGPFRHTGLTIRRCLTNTSPVSRTLTPQQWNGHCAPTLQ
jgi:hypothetical protein